MKNVVLLYILIMFNTKVYAANLNDPQGSSGSWLSLIIVFLIFILLPFFIDVKNKINEHEQITWEKNRKQKNALTICQKKYLLELLRRHEFLNSFDGQSGSLYTVRREAINGINNINIADKELFNYLKINEYLTFEQFCNEINSKEKVKYIKDRNQDIIDAINNGLGYYDIFGRIDDIITTIKKAIADS